MVASAKILSGSAFRIAAYHVGSDAADYYATERAGMWWGDAVPALGLPAEVTTHDLQHLLLGMSPAGDALIKTARSPKQAPGSQRASAKIPSRNSDNRQDSAADGDPRSADKTSRAGAKVVPLTRSSRVPGLEVTFSVPKSVSAYWASCRSTALRKSIEESVIAAVRETLMTLRETVPLARRGKAGTEMLFAELAVAMFLHTVSRDLEPQLHVHCIFPNLVRTAEGRWSSINTRLLLAWTPALGRIFRCNLARELSQRVGVSFYRPQRSDGRPESWFEIVGVPRELIDRWSSRRKAIEASFDEKGELLHFSSAKAREAANLATRKPKNHKLDLAALTLKWREEASRLGFDGQAAQALVGALPVASLQKAYPRALAEALKHITHQNAHFNARDLVQEVCERLQHFGVSGRLVVRHVLRDLNQSPQIIALEKCRGEHRFTTQEMYAVEGRLLEAVQELKKRAGAVVSEARAEKALDRASSLSTEQRDAARYLLCGPGSIRVLSGVAGAGKSSTLDAVREGFERAGFRVLGGALSGSAKEELARQAHIDSRTIASYLHHLDKSTVTRVRDRVKHDVVQMIRALFDRPTHAPTKVKLDRKTVLILDEAAMVDTRTLDRLIHHVKKAGATLLLAGDWQQLPPILAGSPMERISKEVGGVSLQENRRQIHAADREAVADLRRGDVAKAFKNYADRERVTIGRNTRDTINKLVDSWRDNGGCRRPKDHMIFTQTRLEAAAINRLCQSQRLRSFQTVPLLSVRHGATKYHIGDRVLFHEAMRSQAIENGYRGTVIAVNPLLRELKVKLDEEPSAKAKAQGASRFVSVPLSKLGPEAISLSYASTTHKLQGQTVQHSYLLLAGPMTSREMAYVQATRARDTTRFFIDDLHAGRELKDLISAVTKSKAKNLAHDLEPRAPRQEATWRPMIG